MFNEDIDNGLSVLPDTSLFKQKMMQTNQNENLYNKNILNDDLFLPGFLSKNLGRWMKVESVVGNSIVTKIGQLIKVGAGFIVLKLNTNPISSVVCEMGCIKFVTILYNGRIKE